MYSIFERLLARTRTSHQLSGFTVRFFLVDEGPFFLARVTLIGSGVLARVSSSGTSYCWNDGIVGGGVDIRSNKPGVCCRETGTGCSETTPSGISPSFSTTKWGGADREVSLRSANRRGSSNIQSVHQWCESLTRCRGPKTSPLGSGGSRSSNRTTGIESTSSTPILVGCSSVI